MRMACWIGMVVGTALVVATVAPPMVGAKKPRPPKPVSITDAATNTGAGVDANGNLKVILPGAVDVNLPGGVGGAALDADGNLQVRAVPAAPERPVTTINDLVVQSGSTQQLLFSGTGGSRLSITSLTFAAEGPNAGSVRMFISVYVSSTAGDSCSNIGGGNFGAAERLVVLVPIGQTLNVVYPSPLVYSQYADDNDLWCIVASSSGSPPVGYMVHVSGSGFLNF
jgi:hypothetical protein